MSPAVGRAWPDPLRPRPAAIRRARPHPLRPRPAPLRRTLVTGAVAAMALAACGPDDGGPADTDGGPVDTATGGAPASTGTGTAGASEEALTGDLTVFAAASLHEVFTDLGTTFEQLHPGLEVLFSFAGSADLVAQVGAGAPADVLATADERTMSRAREQGLVAGTPSTFATNHLVLVTPADNPAGVTGFDASLTDTALVVCAPQVPCGAATATVAERAEVTLSPVSEESSVTDVLGKVTSGQADAGLVYASDAASAGEQVRTFPVPGADGAANSYPVAVVAGTGNAAAAEDWVEWVQGPEATEALTAAGFP